MSKTKTIKVDKYKLEKYLKERNTNFRRASLLIGKSENYFTQVFTERHDGRVPIHNLDYLALLLREKPSDMFKAVRYEGKTEAHEAHNENLLIKKVGEAGNQLNANMISIKLDLLEIRENLKAMMEDLGVDWRKYG